MSPISWDANARIFAVTLATSVYCLRVAEDGRLCWHAWGARPAAGHPGGGLAWRAGGGWLMERSDQVVTPGHQAEGEPTLRPSIAAPGRSGIASGEAAHLPVRDLRLAYVSHRIAEDLRPAGASDHGQATAVTLPRPVLAIRLEDAEYRLAVTVCLRPCAEHDLIEQWLLVENLGAQPVEFDQLYAATLHLAPGGQWELTTFGGAWGQEFTPERRVLSRGLTVVESRTLTSGHRANPVFLLNRPGSASDDAGEVFAGQLAWSGAWRVVAERLAGELVRVHAGWNPADFRLSLAPGAQVATPALALARAADGWNGAARRLHAFLRERVLPQAPAQPSLRPVLYNSWEATYFGVTLEGQLALARQAAAIGVELFVVDDGWFGARRDDRAGLGDWTPASSLFPHGLTPLVEEIHRLGMRFGLWVEPEMVNPDSDLYRAHPDWVLHHPGRPRTESRNQLILDLGRPEVVEHLLTVLDRLVRENHIDFLKWDFNRPITEAGSVAGRSLFQAHVAGVYRIMDGLRRRHPGLAIQTCSGGGGRSDAGMFARCEQGWTSDNTDALDRTAIQDGYISMYPARTMECWVTHEHNHQTGRHLSLDLRFDAAMRGVLGIGAALDRLTSDELAAYAQHVAFYKRIRHLVQEGTFHRLQRSEDSGVSAWQFGGSTARECVLSIIVTNHKPGCSLPPLRPIGLDPTRIYDAYDRSGLRWSANGWDLLVVGQTPIWEGDRAPNAAYGYSRTWHLVARTEVSA